MIRTRLARMAAPLNAVAGALTLLLGLVALAAPAQAEYNFCNKTSFYLFTGIAYEINGDLVAQGWWPLRPGECEAVIEAPLDGGRYYTFAESHWAHRGGKRTWAGSHPFCTEDDSFELRRDECDLSVAEHRLFARVDIGDSQNWTTDFTELEGFTLNSARIAGIQRLLRDTGEDPGAIDGNMGNETRRAISRAKQVHDIRVSGLLPDELVDKLVEVAADQHAEHGFRFCNETGFTLWTALAYEEGGMVTSRGWFRIPASDCVKVVKDRLPAREFFTYAEAELEDGQRIIWGGDKELCTSTVSFEIRGAQECEARGFEATGFQTVETQGEPGWTQTFVYQGADEVAD